MWATNPTVLSVGSFLFCITELLGVVFPVTESGYHWLQMNIRSNNWGICTFLFFLIMNLVKFTSVKLNFAAVKEAEKENFMGCLTWNVQFQTFFSWNNKCEDYFLFPLDYCYWRTDLPFILLFPLLLQSSMSMRSIFNYIMELAHMII